MNKNFFDDNDIKFFKQFKKPFDIQLYLNKIKYNPDYITKSPHRVIIEQKANCFEGALFAAASLRIMGFKPLIVDMMSENDDDHVIALFKKNNFYGAIAKSNTRLLRFREPVYKSLRELVMSYFDFYFNIFGEKSLRSYSNPVDLSMFDNKNWMTTDEDLEFIGEYLCSIKHHKIINSKQIKLLSFAEDDIIDSCFSGAIKEGIFKPQKRK